MSIEKIFDEIVKERNYQDSKWGTAFDDKNTLNDWCVYIVEYLGRASSFVNVDDLANQRRLLLKAVTIGVAALEAFDRNKKFASRHYEK